jgi:hypothetical protein
MVRSRSSLASLVIALVAMSMLSFATVQSIVMQAAETLQDGVTSSSGEGEDAGMTMPEAMPVMAMDEPVKAAPSSDRVAHAEHGHKANCPYCEVAAHLPVPEHVAALGRAMDAVFAVFQAATSRGPRGPPSFELRARGPPIHPGRA